MLPVASGLAELLDDKPYVQALELQLFMGGRRVGHATSRVPLQPAAKRPLDEASLRDALGQLGENTLCLGSLDTSALDLAAGALLLICRLLQVNCATHYQSRMHRFDSHALLVSRILMVLLL